MLTLDGTGRKCSGAVAFKSTQQEKVRMSFQASSIRPASAPRRRLAAGVALLGSSLASTAAHSAALQFTTVNSFTGSLTAGSTTASFTLPGATTYYQTIPPFAAQSGSGLGMVQMVGNSFNYTDIVRFSLGTNYLYADGSGSGSFSLTFSSNVTFTDLAMGWNGISSGILYNGSAVNDGDVFLASGTPYNFTFNYVRTGSVSQQSDVIAMFTAAPGGGGGGGVPLPGAAGLAACGLLGLNRRRRR